MHLLNKIKDINRSRDVANEKVGRTGGGGDRRHVYASRESLTVSVAMSSAIQLSIIDNIKDVATRLVVG